MTIVQSVRAARGLMSKRDRRLLVLAIVAQGALAVLDLVGIILLGLVATMAASTASGEMPQTAADALSRLGLDDVAPLTVALWLALLAAVLLLTKSALSFLLTRRVLRFLAARQVVISGGMAAALLSRPLLFVQIRTTQETAYALTAGINAATLGILGQAVLICSELVLIAVLLAGLAVFDPVVTLFTIVFFGVVALILQRIMTSWAGKLGTDASAAEIESYASVQEAVRTYRETTVTGRRSMYVRRFEGLRSRAASIQADIQVMTQVSKYVFEAALIIGGGLLVASQALSNDLAAGVAVIAVYLVAATRLMPSILRVQSGLLIMRTSVGLAEPTFALAADLGRFDDPDRSGEAPSGEAYERLAQGVRDGFPDFLPTIVLQGVGVAYPDAAAPAVWDVTLSVEAGHSLALVGPTGSGKSTLADLILGVITPDAGSVTLGGRSPAEAVHTWPGAVTYVPQEVVVVKGTVRDNVALGLPDDLVSDERVWEALERAQLAPFLRSHREGLDTAVGENGVMLSGGQRQRLGIARALYTRPRLVVLDEATSALDAETEQAVSDTLAALEGDVTLVIVAHRLATIRHCEVVAYLDGARLVAVGSFDEVRKQAPAFDHQAELLGL